MIFARSLFRAVDEVGHPELAAPFLAVGVDVDADDPVRADQLRALDDVEADAAEAENDDVRARLDLGGLDDCADAGGDSAADVAAGLERRVLADLRHRDLGQHGEVREGRAAHVMEDGLALVAEAASAVGHHALALRRADRGAEVGLAGEARLTLAAFGRVQRDDVVARLHAGDARPDLAHHARALVAEDRGEDAFAVEPVERVGVGVADAGRHDLDQHFALLRAFEVDLDDLERLLGLESDGGAGLHCCFSIEEPAHPAGDARDCRSARRARRAPRRDRSRGRSASRSAPWRSRPRIPDGTGS